MICCEEEMIRVEDGFLCKKCGYFVNDIELIKNIIQQNPGINAIELARISDIPNNAIIKYLNDGLISTVEHKKNIRGYYVGGMTAKGQWRTDIPSKRK